MLDAIVVGAGHAGVEAALALAHAGKKTALITICINHIASMPCNPSIGGPAKGIVVREIDALGGMMPKVADKTALQFKMLNTTKGPGVWSMRVQSDKPEYTKMMRDICLNTENLEVIEDICEEIIVEDKKIKGVKLKNRGELLSRVVILTTGTYMDSCTMISAEVVSEGPDHEPTTKNLSESLRKNGIRLFRLKTGTPPRVRSSTIDFSKTQYEPGTNEKLRFSEESEDLLPFEKQLPCYLTYTTPKTLEIIRNNLNKSSMYSGVVKGVGPRYCPSIEDKVVRFADKERHQLFLEPIARDLDLTYVQGFSTSMPRDVQEEMVHSLIGLEKAEIVKYAYAIEYDAIDPLQVKANLEMKEIDGLFIGGQILGTSGYEEAAGLGIMAGINALRKLDNKEALILKRDEAYIGVMIDDLVTKGTKEPYRLLTSRSEYRLLMRHDNAEERLIKYGYENGLISAERYNRYLNDENKISELKDYLKDAKVSYETGVNEYLNSLGFETEENKSYNAYELIKRPGVELMKILELLNRKDEYLNICKNTEIQIKYEGYIDKARKEAEKMLKMDNIKLRADLDYKNIDNLALEARQKLDQIKPLSLGQASRISGINPSDIQVLAVYLRQHNLG
ncbi:MAG: tRNA uridine-5-carboxymethylaminomethyl(34) synthesis enzyme MnmG [Solobacterium sp.]|nr:tRNA uridine-5-carboxymethylaminomethyl(34) synthesis enzyme MnmG [Erysipelotrichaceae bacterium]MDD6886754.1 tRNA uridine-5-carboxymethylaminomethyl(34) synthesis enzyme MnmG [Solobacterium sp.]MDY5654299.1 tRNA uridine-5-carboxymethylaminomethyl(34) synthesis enzyme MnmG [Erysipelotrichaceae bacterium]